MLGLVACAALRSAARAATDDRDARAEPAWLAPHNRALAPTAVHGRVADQAGHGIAGALIVPQPTGAFATPALAVSDARGQFEFIGLPPGDYCFVAIRLGYAPVASPVMPVEDRLRVAIVLGGSTSI